MSEKVIDPQEVLQSGAIALRDVNTKLGAEGLNSTEISKEDEAEIVGGTLDVLYGVTDGKLWQGSVRGVVIQSDNGGQMFNEGTLVSFVPFVSGEVNHNEKKGIFIFSENGGNDIAATYSVSSVLEDNDGHLDVEGNVNLIVENEKVTRNSVLLGINLLAVSYVKQLSTN